MEQVDTDLEKIKAEAKPYLNKIQTADCVLL